MTRPSAGRNENCIEPWRKRGKLGVALQKDLRRPGDSLALDGANGRRGLVQLRPALDLDEDQYPAAARNQVDLADAEAETPGQDAVALET